MMKFDDFYEAVSVAWIGRLLAVEVAEDGQFYTANDLLNNVRAFESGIGITLSTATRGSVYRTPDEGKYSGQGMYVSHLIDGAY